MTVSGHSHRVSAFLSLLDLPHQFVETTAETRASDEFRKLNPLGQVPVLQDGELALADSAAILTYLARRYAPNSHWLPQDPVGAARVQRWLALAAGELRFGPGAARVIELFGGKGDLAKAQEIGRRLLEFMDAHLAGRQWLAAEHPTIADLAHYGYVACAPEGGLALEPYEHVRRWIERVEALPRMLPMPRSRPAGRR
jgi:glutathione S-transferase